VSQRTTGSFKALLERLSLSESVLMVEKRSVPGLMSETTLRVLLDAYKPLVQDVEARNRVKRCAIVPMSVAIAAASAYGRCEQTVALMRGLNQLPRLWQLQIEQEQNRAALEVDLVLNDEIEEAELEEAADLAHELSTMVPFQPERADDSKADESWRLRAIPEAMERELEAYAAFRQQAINIHRQGPAVVPITCENDRSNLLRFCGFLAAERQIQAGLGIFAQPDVGQWASDWVNALRAKGLKFSSLSNYVNSLSERRAHPTPRPAHIATPTCCCACTQSPSALSCTTRTASTHRSTRCTSRHWKSS